VGFKNFCYVERISTLVSGYTEATLYFLLKSGELDKLSMQKLINKKPRAGLPKQSCFVKPLLAAKLLNPRPLPYQGNASGAKLYRLSYRGMQVLRRLDAKP